ncbi:hypothetical protein RSAG8_05733, partial [Rhizoctonia solani AG-8 WAC10335]
MQGPEYPGYSMYWDPLDPIGGYPPVGGLPNPSNQGYFSYPRPRGGSNSSVSYVPDTIDYPYTNWPDEEDCSEPCPSGYWY